MGELGALIKTTSFDIDEECLCLAEESAEEVINCLHPTLDSEERRWDVIDYIQRSIKSKISSCEVFPYGSVPLKTYLPDGDIDLTTIKSPKDDESLAREVFALFQAEEQNINAEFKVQDTKFIDAEVKLVKCIVRNIVIDLSFNQLGGLSTLCFLERVDRIVGRNHLFKRSIILVKTWCYYESRILGSYHGLISTYALETLVLYILQFFHSSLSGPLSVLYKFLDYYSQFDWENYCISLQGPICKSSLPNIVVKMPESGSSDLMLGQAFLKNCIDLFSVQSRELETNPRAFQTKHLNIIDPLKENNNLGRSVHKGNFYRIRSALNYGVRKLRQVFLQPKDRVANEISLFFANTLARHGRQQQHSSIRHLALELEESLAVRERSTLDMFSDDDLLLLSSISEFDDESVGFEDKPITDMKNEIDGYSARETSSDYTSSSIGSASLGIHSHKLQFPSESSVENGSLQSHQFELLNCAAEKFSFDSWLENRDKYVETNKECQWCLDDKSKAGCTCSNSWTPKAIIFDCQNFGDMDSMSIGGESEALDPLADLSGDYESHVRSLLYGQLCHISALCTPAVDNPSPAPSKVKNLKPWDVIHQSMPIRQTAASSQMNPVTMPMEAFRQTAAFSQMDLNATPMQPIRQTAAFSQINLCTTLTEQTVNPPATDPEFRTTAFCYDGKERAQGTGMYFPKTNALYMEKSAYGRGRKRTPRNRNPLQRSGSFPTACGEVDNAARWVPPAQNKPQGQWRSDHSPWGSNGYLSRSCRIEFGSIGNLGEEVISCSNYVISSKPRAPLKTQQCSKAIMKQEKVGSGQSIHLKNEDEFPPLCQ